MEDAPGHRLLGGDVEAPGRARPLLAASADCVADLLLCRWCARRPAGSSPQAARSVATREQKESDKAANQRLLDLAEAAQEGMLARDRVRIERRDLERIGLLGCGGFGAVHLVEQRGTGQAYALKSLSKGFVVKSGMQDSVRQEKAALLAVSSDFVIGLHETYSGRQHLYFLLEAALGGELYATYQRERLYGSEPHCRFYAAATALALDHLHQRSLIHRNVKPEDLVLTETGRLKLVDMGLSKFVAGKTYTTCGTPDYFAPELIESRGHDRAVDWWCLGILVFELMAGDPPFSAASPMQIYSKIMDGINRVTFPPRCEGPVGCLIRSLLQHDPDARLPMSQGIDGIKGHRWYRGFDWPAMIACTMEPPYKPVVKSKTDISNFSAREEDKPRQIEYVDDGSGWDRNFATAP